ncbi:MAG: glycosyltransferase family 8 protein [Lachnospiraceae bacterium]|nr:glycosyltransferase family 8 protein [Lachnospiraceae bacterium]
MKEIPVFFTVDDDYVPYLDCALRSMMENASKEYHYKIIVLEQDVSEEHKALLAEAVKPPFEMIFMKMKDSYSWLTDREENWLRCDYFTLTIYFRLFIADMFPQYDKGIYLDSDIVVPGDISKLYEVELGDRLLAVCTDQAVTAVPELSHYAQEAIGVKNTDYFNSGIMVMNLEKLREEKFADQFMRLLNTWHLDCIAPDQDYLNAICQGRVVMLDGEWDVMPPAGENETLVKEPKLIHYNLFSKPWCYDDIAYEEYFWKYAEQSPFYQDILRHKEGYSEEQKRSDADCMATMVRKAATIDGEEVTFRKLRDQGERIRL